MGCIQRKRPNDPNQDFISRIVRLNKEPSISISNPITSLLKSDYSYEAKTAKKIERKKTSSDLALIKSCLTKSIIFSGIKEGQISQVSELMTLIEIDQGELIIEENTPGHMFFIISMGLVEVSKDNKRINILRVGESFGELALIHDTLRTSTVKSQSLLQLWAISREEFKVLLERINIENFDKNREFLQRVPVFSEISEAQMAYIINSSVQMSFKENSKILGINQIGESLYIIKEGTVSCIVKGEEKTRLHQGDYFGEISILTNAPRNASVIALNNVICLMVSKKTLNLVFEGKFQKILYHNIILEKLKSLKSLSILQESQLKSLASNFEILQFNNSIFIPKDTPLASNIWIILNGSLKLENQELEKYSILGIHQIINGDQEVLQDDIFAEGECEIGKLSGEKFRELLENDYKNIEELNNIIHILKKNPCFKESDFLSLYDLLKEKKIEKFENGEFLLKIENNVEKVTLLKSGIVKIDDHEEDGRGNVFGISEVIVGAVSKSDVICVENCEGIVFAADEIQGLFDRNILEVLKGRMILRNLKIESKDLVTVGKIGTSTQAHKYICQINDSQLIKVTAISKSTLVTPFKSYIQHEIQASNKIDHILISPILSSFSDTSGLYLLTEFVPGVALSSQVNLLNNVHESIFKFYFSCLTEIVHYLSDHHLIHRNLAIDNFLIDKEGYIHLIDTTFLTPSEKNRTFTKLGSPYYLAPEVINNKGYTVCSMYWTLGILLFEMICKEVPFGNGENDPFAVYEKILKKRIVFPSMADKYSQSKKIIEQLLCKNSALRMPGGASKFKLQSYFSEINWKELRQKKVKPSILPTFAEFAPVLFPGPLIPETTEDSPTNWNKF